MDQNVVSISLKSLVAPRWGSREEENRHNLGDGWDLAEQIATLHLEAVKRISPTTVGSPSRSDEATFLLACHGLNLFMEIMVLIVRGLFDVSAHLMRGMMDASSLVYACSYREDLADKYMTGDYKASEARKLLVADLRSQDAALAEDIDRQLADDADAANNLSHVSSLHADKLVAIESGRITPFIWGSIDREEARRQSRAALYSEHWLLVPLKAFRGGAVGQTWIDQFDGLNNRLHKYIKSS